MIDHENSTDSNHFYPPTYLLTYRSTYLPTYLQVHLPSYVCTYLPTYLPTYLQVYLPSYVRTYLQVYLPTGLSSYLPTYLPTGLQTYLSVYLPIYLLTNLPEDETPNEKGCNQNYFTLLKDSFISGQVIGSLISLTGLEDLELWPRERTCLSN